MSPTPQSLPKRNPNAIIALLNQTSGLGLGGAPLGNLYRSITDQAARELIDHAWQNGIRLFDTAPHYGQGLSERRLGDALRDPERQQHVLSTKAGRLLRPAGYARERHGFHSPMPFEIAFDYSRDGILRSYEDSLQRLGLPRIELLLMHDLGEETHGNRHEYYFQQALNGGFEAMMELRADGGIQAIGLGVNECEICERVLDHGDWDLFLLAGRYTLLEQGALNSLLPKCEAANVRLIIGGPYNSGILATGAGTSAHYNYVSAPPAVLKRVTALETVCARYNVPLAAAALQFPLAHPSVISVIPGIDSRTQLDNTLDLMKCAIPLEFWDALKKDGLLHEGAPTPGGLSRRD